MPKPPDSPPEDEASGIRLQRVLAAAGVGSRRACEELIAQGRVSVDGVPVKAQGMRVDPDHAVIRVDGERIRSNPRLAYFVVNKPVGTVSTLDDPQGRPTVGDLVPGSAGRLFHVGRLDTDSEGLLLLTNDGELAHRLMHPSYEVPKTYLAEIAGPLPRGVGAQLRRGIDLEDGPGRVDGFRVVTSARNRLLVEVVVHEGRNRFVRRLFDAIGYPVLRLARTGFGPLRLGELGPGRSRPASAAEVAALYKAVGL
jgi:23S rRNA pseudouridine2605 synthase